MLNRNHLTEMRWFEGVVENRMDPLRLGRVQVRIFGLHTEDMTQIPEAELLWASVMMPVTGATMNGIGETPALVEGTHVIGFFRDGDQSQDAIIMGSVPGVPVKERMQNEGFNDHRTSFADTPAKPVYSGSSFSEASKNGYPKKQYLDEPDINRLARNEKANEDTCNVSKNGSLSVHGNVVPNPYNAKYPYNKVLETESGHVIEMDDTVGAERVSIFHRTGTYIEMYPDGRIVINSKNDTFSLVDGSFTENVTGAQKITIGSNGELNIGGNFNFNVSGNVNWNIGGNVNFSVGGTMSIAAGPEFKATAGVINLN